MRSGVLGNFGWGLKVRSIIYFLLQENSMLNDAGVKKPANLGHAARQKIVPTAAALSREQLDTCWQMGARKENYDL